MIYFINLQKLNERFRIYNAIILSLFNHYFNQFFLIFFINLKQLNERFNIRNAIILSFFIHYFDQNI